MNQIVVDSELHTKLNDRSPSAELTDCTGKRVGYFMSEEAFERIVETVLPEPSAEDLADARREMLETGGVGTEKILDAIRDAERKWNAR